MVRTRRGNQVPNNNTDGANMNVTEPMKGVDFNHDSGGVTMEEPVINAENKLVIPGGIVASFRVDSCQKSPVRVNPCNCIGFHLSRDLDEILCRNNIEFQ
jgi:hypothetical protein